MEMAETTANEASWPGQPTRHQQLQRRQRNRRKRRSWDNLVMITLLWVIRGTATATSSASMIIHNMCNNNNNNKNNKTLRRRQSPSSTSSNASRTSWWQLQRRRRRPWRPLHQEERQFHEQPMILQHLHTHNLRGGGDGNHDEDDDDDDDTNNNNNNNNNDSDDDNEYRFTFYNIQFDPTTQHFRAVIRPSPPTDPNPPPSLHELEEQAQQDERSNNNENGANRMMMIDRILDQLVGTEPGIVTDRFVSSRLWMWHQWSTTLVLRYLLPSIFKSTVYSVVVCASLQRYLHGDFDLASLLRPMSGLAAAAATTVAGINSSSGSNVNNILNIQEIVIQILSGISRLWATVFQPLVTLLLVAFLAHACMFWTSVYNVGRNVQARINDLQLLLATHASRQESRDARYSGTNNNNNVYGYTADAEVFLYDIHHTMRATHILWWAAHARRYRVLLTDHGLSRMVARGILTPDEKELLELQQLTVPKTQCYIVLVEYMVWKCQEARKNNGVRSQPRHRRQRRFGQQQRSPLLVGDDGFQPILLDKFCALRTCFGQLSHKMAGRVPMTYALYVQVLIDSFLLMAPVAQFFQMGPILAVLSSILLSLFYGGLLDLAFAMLDPLGEEVDFFHRRTGALSPVYLDLSVFIRESTAASRRWIQGASKLKW